MTSSRSRTSPWGMGTSSGRSTLLRTMTGLYRPRHGRILLDGNDIYAAEGEQRSRLLRQFGVTFQSGALFGSMTLLENVRLPIDEFTDLDPGEKELVALAKLNELGSVYAIADRCVLLDREARTIVAEGRPADLRDHSRDPRVRRFFQPELEPDRGAIAL